MRSLPCAALAALLCVTGCGLGDNSVGPKPDADYTGIIDASLPDGPPPERFGETPSCATLVRADKDHIYWEEGAEGEFARLYRSRDEAFAPELVLPNALGLVDYAADRDEVYWITDDRLARTSLADGHTDFAPAVSGRFYRGLAFAAGTLFVRTEVDLIAIPGWGADEIVLADRAPSLLVASGAVVLTAVENEVDHEQDVTLFSGTTLASRTVGHFPFALVDLTIVGEHTLGLDPNGVLRDAISPVPIVMVPDANGPSPARIRPFGNRLVALFADQISRVDLDTRVIEPLDDRGAALAETAKFLFWTRECSTGTHGSPLVRLPLP